MGQVRQEWVLVLSFILSISIGKGIRTTYPGVRAGECGNWGFTYPLSA